jgi:hypothetical protein
MPTGYTADVADGKVTDLKTFALRCARGMGALVMMRDDPWDKPIPARFEPSDYHTKLLAEKEAEYAEIFALTLDQSNDRAMQDHVEWQEGRARYFAGKDEQRDRYNAMIAKVEAWEGSPEGLKGFMLDQLRESVRFDAPSDREYYVGEPSLDGAEWRSKRLTELLREIAYSEKAVAEELERTAGRNGWIAQLHASLEGEA